MQRAKLDDPAIIARAEEGVDRLERMKRAVAMIAARALRTCSRSIYFH
jgi:hypothetical protein